MKLVPRNLTSTPALSLLLGFSSWSCFAVAEVAVDDGATSTQSGGTSATGGSAPSSVSTAGTGGDGGTGSGSPPSSSTAGAEGGGAADASTSTGSGGSECELGTSAHCAACNHDCNGGSCEQGMCTPVVVAEMNLPGGDFLQARDIIVDTAERYAVVLLSYNDEARLVRVDLQSGASDDLPGFASSDLDGKSRGGRKLVRDGANLYALLVRGIGGGKVARIEDAFCTSCANAGAATLFEDGDDDAEGSVVDFDIAGGHVLFSDSTTGLATLDGDAFGVAVALRVDFDPSGVGWMANDDTGDVHSSSGDADQPFGEGLYRRIRVGSGIGAYVTTSGVAGYVDGGERTEFESLDCATPGEFTKKKFDLCTASFDLELDGNRAYWTASQSESMNGSPPVCFTFAPHEGQLRWIEGVASIATAPTHVYFAAKSAQSTTLQVLRMTKPL